MPASSAAVPIRQDVFLQNFNESSDLSANTPRLPDSALIALPYIGALVGVDQQIPSKVIYAIYDPEGPGLRYVHGDGAFVHAENVCFMNRFTGGSQCRPDLAPRQRTHFIELLKRSAFYYQALLSPNTMEYAKIKVEFPNPTAVKEALTYLQDLNLGKDVCPALKQIPPFSPSDPCIQDQSVPCITLSSPPTWDFRPSIGFQARVSRNQEAELLKKHKEFIQKYQCQMSFFDFQQSTFCLVGLANENLISFLSEKQNDTWNLEAGSPSNFQRELIRPLRTAAGWTPDCFLARFGKFERFVEKLGLSCPPSPVNWLEAELGDEKRLERAGRIKRLIKPWKGTIYGKVVPGVLEWEFLQTLVWQNGGDEKAGIRRYPRPFESVRWRPLTMAEIIRSRPSLEDDARKKLEAELKENIKKERPTNRYRESRQNDKDRILSQLEWDEEDEGDISSNSIGNPDNDNLPETSSSHEQNGESSSQEQDTIEPEVTLSNEDMYHASDREISRKRKHTRSISSPDEERRPLKGKGEYLLRTDIDQIRDIHINTNNQETQQPPVTSSAITGMGVLSNIFGSDIRQKSTAKSPRISEPPIITGMDILSDIFGPRTITKNTVAAIIKQERASKKYNEGESSMQLGCDKRRKIRGSLPQQASSVASSHSIANEEGDTEIEGTNTNKELSWISHEPKL